MTSTRPRSLRLVYFLHSMSSIGQSALFVRSMHAWQLVDSTDPPAAAILSRSVRPRVRFDLLTPERKPSLKIESSSRPAGSFRKPKSEQTSAPRRHRAWPTHLHQKRQHQTICIAPRSVCRTMSRHRPLNSKHQRIERSQSNCSLHVDALMIGNVKDPMDNLTCSSFRPLEVPGVRVSRPPRAARAKP